MQQHTQALIEVLQQSCNKAATKLQHSCNKAATQLQQSCNTAATPGTNHARRHQAGKHMTVRHAPRACPFFLLIYFLGKNSQLLEDDVLSKVCIEQRNFFACIEQKNFVLSKGFFLHVPASSKSAGGHWSTKKKRNVHVSIPRACYAHHIYLHNFLIIYLQRHATFFFEGRVKLEHKDAPPLYHSESHFKHKSKAATAAIELQQLQ